MSGEGSTESTSIRSEIDALLKATPELDGILDNEPEEAKESKIWQVIAGSQTGGLLVREGRALTSTQLPDRLSTGALVEEIELVGERLHFFRLTGTGPIDGWVSTKQKGAALLLPAQVQEPSQDEWVYSEEQAKKDYDTGAKEMRSARHSGTYSAVHGAAVSRSRPGQLRVCCLCCAEAGHLTPMLRVARGLAVREGIWRVTFLTNAYGAGKVAGWLQSDPDRTGKIEVLGYVDGWSQELQDLSNKYAQAEDGKLLGLQNDAVPVAASACLEDLHGSGDDRPAIYVVDGASSGYLRILDVLEPPPKWVMSVALVVIASILYSHHDAPLFFHCFQLPPAMEAFSTMGKRPPALTPCGIIVDEVKLTVLPQPLEEFLAASDLPVVYVSMGSQGVFTRKQLRLVAAGLRAPGEWRVIWSLREPQQRLLPGGSPEALGPDFHVASWLPQAELLQHPKVKAFMSHCGWGATCEAIMSCKPVIAFPLFADQNFNAFFMELFGMSKRVCWDKLNPMDAKAVMVRFAKTMELWNPHTKRKRLRDCFTAKALNEDVRSVLKDESYARGAQMLHFYNKQQRGGVHKLAELIEGHARG